MTVLHIRDYPKIKAKPAKGPPRDTADVDSIVMWQDAIEVDMCCICCAYRWSELVALSMMERPQWMGELSCPEPDCGAHGFVVRG